MKQVAEFGSRSGKSSGHRIFEDQDGNLLCSCPAGNHGRECWALRKVKGERYLEQNLAAIRAGEETQTPAELDKSQREFAQSNRREREYWEAMFADYATNHLEALTNQERVLLRARGSLWLPLQ